MATSDRPPGPGLPPDIVATLLMVAVAFTITKWPPLESTRPRGAEPAQTVTSGLQDVRGRLWQDPFQAVARYVGQTSIPEAGSQTPTGQMAGGALGRPLPAGSNRLPTASKAGPIDGNAYRDPCMGSQTRLILAANQPASVSVAASPGAARFHQLTKWLAGSRGHDDQDLVPAAGVRSTTDIVGIMVFGGDTKEGIEYRQRTRYAVVSGLSVVGQFPISEVGLGYFEWPDAMATSSRAEYQGQVRVPFEVFHDAKDRQRALLLWLDENGLPEDSALGRIGRLVTCLRDEAGVGGRNVIIGPVGSQMLGGMTRELAGMSSSRPPAFQIFTTATASGAEIARRGEAPGQGRVDIPRAVLTDDAIMAALIRELGLRGADVVHNRGVTDRVVLVSEWDTLYGRALPDTFVKVLCKKSERCEEGGRPPWVHRFSYLRALDGAPAEASAAKGKAEKEKSRLSELWPMAPSERAEGDGQFDYLRRLARHIHAFESVAVDGTPPGRVAAIGVLGSDVYDKLLVLRALRGEFPKAIFFTTDLDARLLHPEESAWTRNLVVGSTFGLQLHPDLQKHIPPFRDSYQTATFLAVQAAFVKPWLEADPAVIHDELARKIHPRVFEIGRNDAFDVSSERVVAGRRCPELAFCDNVHPEPDAVIPWPRPLTVVKGSALLLFAVGFVFLGSGRLRAGTRRVALWWRRASRAARHRMVIAAVAMVATTGIAVAVALSEGQDGEPLRLTAGVSMWPTEIIRYLAAVLSAGSIVWVRVTIERVRAALGREFAPGLPPVETPRYPGFWGWIKGIGPALFDRVPASHREPVDAWKLWRHYVAESTLSSQLQRVIPLGGLFWVACVVIISFDWPQAPFRGPAAHWIDSTLIRFVCAPLFIWLMFSVSDAIRLGGRYARLLGAEGATMWPDSMVRHAARRLGLLMGRDLDRRAIEDEVLSRWLDVHVIARWTQVVAPLIYCPFVVLTLMIISRSPLFDRWGTPWPLFLVFGVSAIYGVVSALALRHIAERARRTALKRLGDLLIQAKGQAALATLSAQIEEIIRQTESLREGAFARFAEQPVVRAVLLPLGSGSGLVVLRNLFGWGA